LATLNSSDGRLALAGLLYIADRGNPFVVVESQLESTLGKLVGSGLLRIYEDWSLEMTDEGIALLEDVHLIDGGYLQAVRERLALVDPTPTRVKVPQKVLEARQEVE
jgi:hypothetical protein